jgi:hypothetical protein
MADLRSTSSLSPANQLAPAGAKADARRTRGGPGTVLADRPGRIAGFDVAGQQLENLAEGQIWVTQAGMGVAVSPGHDQVGMACLGAPGELLDQRGLAPAGAASDKYHPTPAGQGLLKKAVQARQLVLSSNEGCVGAGGRGSRGEKGRRGVRSWGAKGRWGRGEDISAAPLLRCPPVYFPCHYLLIQTGRLRRWFDAQVFVQQTTAGLVLGQSRLPLTAERQQAHQCPVSFFLPGIKLHLSPGVFESFLMLALRLKTASQAAQGVQVQTPQPFPIKQGPLFKGGAVAQGKAGQEFPPVKGYRVHEPAPARIAELKAVVLVRLAGVEQGGKRGDIQLVVARGVKLERLGGDVQEGWAGLVVADGAPQLEEGLGEVLARAPLGLLGPQQTGQRFPSMGAVGFNGQVCQQGPHLVIAKGGDRFPGQVYPEGSQQTE